MIGFSFFGNAPEEQDMELFSSICCSSCASGNECKSLDKTSGSQQEQLLHIYRKMPCRVVDDVALLVSTRS